MLIYSCTYLQRSESSRILIGKILMNFQKFHFHVFHWSLSSFKLPNFYESVNKIFSSSKRDFSRCGIQTKNGKSAYASFWLAVRRMPQCRCSSVRVSPRTAFLFDRGFRRGCIKWGEAIFSPFVPSHLRSIICLQIYSEWPILCK